MIDINKKIDEILDDNKIDEKEKESKINNIFKRISLNEKDIKSIKNDINENKKTFAEKELEKDKKQKRILIKH